MSGFSNGASSKGSDILPPSLVVSTDRYSIPTVVTRFPGIKPIPLKTPSQPLEN